MKLERPVNTTEKNRYYLRRAADRAMQARSYAQEAIGFLTELRSTGAPEDTEFDRARFMVPTLSNAVSYLNGAFALTTTSDEEFRKAAAEAKRMQTEKTTKERRKK